MIVDLLLPITIYMIIILSKKILSTFLMQGEFFLEKKWFHQILFKFNFGIKIDKIIRFIK